MNTELAQFSLAYTELHYVREGFTLHKERWYAWNYWAQHHGDFSLISWLVENNLEFSDIQAKTNYPNADIIRNREEGYKYYSAWRGAKKAVEDAEKRFDVLFEELYTKYSNEELGKQIGKSGEQLRKFASKKSWYKPRKKKRISNEAV